MGQEKTPFKARHAGGMDAQDAAALGRPDFI